MIFLSFPFSISNHAYMLLDPLHFYFFLSGIRGKNGDLYKTECSPVYIHALLDNVFYLVDHCPLSYALKQ